MDESVLNIPVQSTAKIISSASKCNIKQFICCMFEQKYNVLVIEGEASDEALMHAWDKIYVEYCDLSGQSQTEELSLLKIIGSLGCRVEKIKLLIKIQRDSLDLIGYPFMPGFEKFLQFGHRVKWFPQYPDEEGLRKQLDSIETKEKRYSVEYEMKMKELELLRTKGIKKPKGNGRKEFIKLLNYLDKYGFKVNEETTTVERLSLMIADYNIACEQALADSEKAKRR